MSNLVKDDNLDDDGNWVVNFRISIEDVRMLYCLLYTSDAADE